MNVHDTTNTQGKYAGRLTCDVCVTHVIPDATLIYMAVRAAVVYTTAHTAAAVGATQFLCRWSKLALRPR